MSRIGKKPVEIPSGVEVKLDGQTITVKGPKGTETVTVRDEIKMSVQDNHIILEPLNDERKTGALHGLSRTLVANAIEGVSKGFEKKLEIQGVGYRANMEGTKLNLVLGFSHPVLIDPPEGITITVDANTKISVKGSNKQTVRYEGEYIRRKAGKAGKK